MSLSSVTVGIRTDTKPRSPVGSWVTLELVDGARAFGTVLKRDQALDLAARLIQAVTGLAPMDLSGIVERNT